MINDDDRCLSSVVTVTVHCARVAVCRRDRTYTSSTSTLYRQSVIPSSSPLTLSNLLSSPLRSRSSVEKTQRCHHQMNQSQRPQLQLLTTYCSSSDTHTQETSLQSSSQIIQSSGLRFFLNCKLCLKTGSVRCGTRPIHFQPLNVPRRSLYRAQAYMT